MGMWVEGTYKKKTKKKKIFFKSGSGLPSRIAIEICNPFLHVFNFQ